MRQSDLYIAAIVSFRVQMFTFIFNFFVTYWCLKKSGLGSVEDTDQWSGRILGITGWDPSVCKSNRLHVHILRFSFSKLGYILWIPLRWSVKFLQSWTSTSYFSKLTGSSATNCRFSPIIDTDLAGTLNHVKVSASYLQSLVIGWCMWPWGVK